MWRALAPVMICTRCQEPVALEDENPGPLVNRGVLHCHKCGARFDIDRGIPHLGSKMALHQVADWWEEGTVTQELYRRNIQSSRHMAADNEAYAHLVKTAAAVHGTIVDIASGPGSGLCGAVAPLLDHHACLILTDAAAELLHGLKECWAEVTHRTRLDFWLFDANSLPFKDDSIDAFTSALGFQSVRKDRRRGGTSKGEPYAEATRALKPGGIICDFVALFGPGSETAGHLASMGGPWASRETLEALFEKLGLTVEYAETMAQGRGKVDRADGLPLSEDDEWERVAYVLRKPPAA